MFYNKHL